jgi:pilus assembly protein Flp/PilA
MNYQRAPERGRDPEGDTEMHMDLVRYISARLNVKSERGAALVEYALLLALIAVVCIVALTTLGKQASSKFTDVGNSISAAG